MFILQRSVHYYQKHTIQSIPVKNVLDAEFFSSVVDYHAVKIDGRKEEFILAVNIYNFW